MKDVISNFCKNKENGLFLLDIPTDFGKTYNVLEFIFENYNREEYKNTKFFFITTLKKNLPLDELRERFIKTGKVSEFDQIAIKLESNVESVINNFDTAYKTMPEFIRSDCIYLKKPTHLIVNVKTGINSEDLVKAIFQTEFLMENGEVDYKTGERYIRQTFKCHTSVDFQDSFIKKEKSSK